MDDQVADRVDSDEKILNVDILDDTLERAGGNLQGQAVTWIYCTHAWYDCGWPQ